MRISDWSSDVCSSDLGLGGRRGQQATGPPTLIERAVLEKRLVVEQQRHLAGCRIDAGRNLAHPEIALDGVAGAADHRRGSIGLHLAIGHRRQALAVVAGALGRRYLHQFRRPVVKIRIIGRPEMRIGDIERRSEEHTSELQSLMRISYAVFCWKKKQE